MSVPIRLVSPYLGPYVRVARLVCRDWSREVQCCNTPQVDMQELQFLMVARDHRRFLLWLRTQGVKVHPYAIAGSRDSDQLRWLLETSGFEESPSIYAILTRFGQIHGLRVLWQVFRNRRYISNCAYAVTRSDQLTTTRQLKVIRWVRRTLYLPGDMDGDWWHRVLGMIIKHSRISTALTLLQEEREVNAFCCFTAIRRGSVAILEALKSRGAQYDRYDYKAAVNAGQIRSLQWLLENVDPADNRVPESALVAAVVNNRLDMLQLLLKHTPIPRVTFKKLVLQAETSHAVSCMIFCLQFGLPPGILGNKESWITQ